MTTDMAKKRHPSLIPLSHQHHHGLVLSYRLEQSLSQERVEEPTLVALAAEVVAFFEQDLVPHFAAEEEALFPAMIEHLGELAIVAELLKEHEQMRSRVDQLRRSRSEGTARVLRTFGEMLRDHIRKEERLLFPLFEEMMPESATGSIADHIQQRLRPMV